MGTTVNNLRIVTSVNFAESTLRKLNSMVYLYDPGWIATSSPDDIDTLPFAILEVVKEEIVQSIEVSKKRLILFDPAGRAAKTANTYRESVINIVADNVVNEPLLHKLECLIPADSVNKSLAGMSATTSTVLSYATSGLDADSALSRVLEGTRAVLVAVNAARDVIDRIVKLTNMFTGRSSDYNRRSLLSMARRRAILKYKTWNSWETKSVVISSFNVVKVGTEEEYFRASIELQEVPILYIGKVDDSVEQAPAPNAEISNKLKAAFESVTGTFEGGRVSRAGG